MREGVWSIAYIAKYTPTPTHPLYTHFFYKNHFFFGQSLVLSILKSLREVPMDNQGEMPMQNTMEKNTSDNRKTTDKQAVLPPRADRYVTVVTCHLSTYHT